MISITVAALTKLKTIRVDHPGDPIVRITVRDLDDHRLSFNITLVSSAVADDAVQQIDGLTIAVERHSVSRMDGVTLDYADPSGFRFLHDGEGRSLPLLTIPSLN